MQVVFACYWINIRALFKSLNTSNFCNCYSVKYLLLDLIVGFLQECTSYIGILLIKELCGNFHAFTEPLMTPKKIRLFSLQSV